MGKLEKISIYSKRIKIEGGVSFSGGVGSFIRFIWKGPREGKTEGISEARGTEKTQEGNKKSICTGLLTGFRETRLADRRRRKTELSLGIPETQNKKKGQGRLGVLGWNLREEKPAVFSQDNSSTLYKKSSSPSRLGSRKFLQNGVAGANTQRRSSRLNRRWVP